MLDVRNKICKMGKIANNLEKHGDDEHVTGFAIPISGLLLSGEEVNAFTEIAYLNRLLHNAKRGGGMDPTLGEFEPLAMVKSFENVTATLLLTGDREVEFKACRVKNVTLEAIPGGETNISLQLYVNPGLKRQNLWLQENQGCEIKLTLADAKVATKAKDKQADLPLEATEKDADDDGEDEKASREQAAALERSTPRAH